MTKQRNNLHKTPDHEKLVILQRNTFLTGYERELVPQLQQKGLQIGNQCALQILLVVGRIGLQLQKLQLHRLLDNLGRRFRYPLPTGHLRNRALAIAQ